MQLNTPIETEGKHTPQGSLASALLGLAFMPVMLIWAGFVVMKLWGWFIVPTFGLAPLSLPAAIGLDLLVTYLVAQNIIGQVDHERKHSLWYYRGAALLIASMVLGIGYIVHLFM